MKVHCLHLLLLLIASLLGSCRGPSGAEKEYDEARRYMSQGRYALAAERFEKIGIYYPNTTWAERGLMEAAQIDYLYLKDFFKAIELFQELILSYPESRLSSNARWHMAEIYHYKLTDYSKAIGEYGTILEKKDSEFQTWKILFAIGICHEKMGSKEEAVRYYREVIDGWPDCRLSVRAHFHIANILFSGEKCEEAGQVITELSKTHAESPLVSDALFDLGMCYEEKNQVNEAMDIYRSLLEVHKDREVVEERLTRLESR